MINTILAADCGHSEKKSLFIRNGYHIIECQQCSERFVEIEDSQNHVNSVYSDDYFLKGRSGYPNYLDEKDILINSGKRYAKIISKYVKPGVMLDVGCAAGFIMSGFKESGWDCFGVEPNNFMAGYGRDELSLQIVTGNMENFQSDRKFDMVSMIQVISHFYDFDLALSNVMNLLKPGGMVLIESWNMKSSYARIMGNKWHAYSPPSVIHWFSDETLIHLLKKYNLEIVIKGYPVKQISVKHALSLLREVTWKFPLKKWLINSFTTLIGKKTLVYPFRDVKWYLFQKK
jgi:2-polyprenyl-3-methyl-5-hydroxy-6-metoxy-1,4-benzoquinol methylase